MGVGQITPSDFATACATPGMRIRSGGRGRGLARGRGYGPIGRPFGSWNPFTWFAPKPNFTWNQVKAAGFSDAQIDAYLKGTGLTRWAAERNIELPGMIDRLREYVETGTTTPTGRVEVKVSEETPEEKAWRKFKKGVGEDIGTGMKYVKYALVGVGVFVGYRLLKDLGVIGGARRRASTTVRVSEE